MSGPTLIGPIAQAIVKQLRFLLPPDAVIPEPRPKPPEERVVPATRDELRNGWTDLLVRHVYGEADPPKVARDRFSGRALLALTTQDGGIQEFPQMKADDVRLACAALHRDGGWLVLWSSPHGTGKTTLALWLVLRYLRVLAEERAKAGTKYQGVNNPLVLPKVVFKSWRASIGVLKAQMGRPGARELEAMLCRADLLVLDNVCEMTSWEHVVFEEILGKRYEAGLRTVLVAGYLKGPSDLDDVIGTRGMSIVRERGAVVEVGGYGFRPSTPAMSATTLVPY